MNEKLKEDQERLVKITEEIFAEHPELIAPGGWKQVRFKGWELRQQWTGYWARLWGEAPDGLVDSPGMWFYTEAHIPDDQPFNKGYVESIFISMRASLDRYLTDKVARDEAIAAGRKFWGLD